MDPVDWVPDSVKHGEMSISLTKADLEVNEEVEPLTPLTTVS